jgi:hypothetical protein
VGPGGLEPPTSSLSGKRSNQAELWARNKISLYCAKCQDYLELH